MNKVQENFKLHFRIFAVQFKIKIKPLISDELRFCRKSYQILRHQGFV